MDPLDQAEPAGLRPRRLAAMVLAAALLGAAVGAVAAPDRAQDVATAGDQRGDARPIEPSTSTTGAPPTTEAPPPTLPIPDALPAYAYAPAPQVVLGTLEIPRIGISAPLQQGMTLTAINRGPSHWPGTAMPGEPGNVVVAGHRTTYDQPFHDLDQLVEGDLVHFHIEGAGTTTYAVRGVLIVPAEAIGIAGQDWAHTATLFACHPKGSATHRVVAKLRLLDDALQPVDDDAALPPFEVGLRPEDHTLTVRADSSGAAPGLDPLAGVEG